MLQDFLSLPDASKIVFKHVDAVNLSTLLPNLPPSTTDELSTHITSHSPQAPKSPIPFDLLHRLLIYSHSKRLSAQEGLGHPWFEADPLPLSPTGLKNETRFEQKWEDKTLGDLLKGCLS